VKPVLGICSAGRYRVDVQGELTRKDDEDESLKVQVSIRDETNVVLFH